jgi:hypothetical protein
VYLPDDGFLKAETCSKVSLRSIRHTSLIVLLWRILIKKFISTGIWEHSHHGTCLTGRHKLFIRSLHINGVDLIKLYTDIRKHSYYETCFTRRWTLVMASLNANGVEPMKVSTGLWEHLYYMICFTGRRKLFIRSLHVNGVKLIQLRTVILRTFTSWDIFHRNSQAFHGIAACDCGERKESIHRDTENIRIMDTFHRKAQTFHRIIVCERSERNETSDIVQRMYTNTETKYKQRVNVFY